MKLQDDSKRIGIYLFYDSQGIVDGYVDYFLDYFTIAVDKLVVVCNGQVKEQGSKVFQKYTSDIISRENEGYDVWGYKAGLDYIGWNNLINYDEVVIANNTMIGPFYPLTEMFADMSQKDLDFWGITRHYEFDYDFLGHNEYGYLPEHIQSFFMCFRKSLVQSVKFQKYWDKMPEINDYNQAVGIFETAFTKKFSDYGFTWDTYVDTSDIENLSYFPLMDYPLYLIKEKRCPIVKKRSFFQDYNSFLNSTIGRQSVEVFEYIKDYTEYDENLIWDTLLRTCHQADICKCLQTNYILSSESVEKEENFSDHKIALFMHLYFDDLVDSSVHYASSMPDYADIYITTNTEEKKKVFEAHFSQLQNKVEIRVVPNRGRDVSSLLVSLKDVLPKYEIACFYHDKKSGQSKPGSVGECFGYKCAENVLHNRAFVYRVIKTFVENPRLGILSPPEPNHAEYFASLGHEWFNNFANTKELAKKLGITVPMDETKEPIAPLGSVFWFRVKALKPLHDYPWKYEDFPQEPLPIDETISHAIERIRPYAAQQAGYYPAYVMVDQYARIEFTNLRQYMRNYIKFLERKSMLVGKQSDIIRTMDQRYDELFVRSFGSKPSAKVVTSSSFLVKVERVCKKIIPGRLYQFLIKIKRKIFGPHF